MQLGLAVPFILHVCAVGRAFHSLFCDFQCSFCAVPRAFQCLVCAVFVLSVFSLYGFCVPFSVYFVLFPVPSSVHFVRFLHLSVSILCGSHVFQC